ncbi:MAG: WYL domain-containing protein, partial [Candidatus Gastranaerophilales bacterium]|nr:WYL domain-containing protein [Candidatus Gastranaerophilales bacterium]
MSRLNKTEEIIKLATILQNSYCGKTLDEIAEEFECSRRSAERMKALLNDLFPDKLEEVQTSDKKKRWRFKKGTMNFLVSFTRQDFANLELLKNLVTEKLKQKEIHELIEKIKAINPHNNSLALETGISAVLETEGYAVRQYSTVKVDSKEIEKIRKALISMKKIRFNYRINGEIKSITLNPYGIIISDKYYLVGFNSYKNDLRQYLVNKISNVSVLDEYFEVQDGFNLKEYANNSFGIYQEESINVVLEFDKSVAEDVLNYHFHPSQKIKELPDGNVQVRFSAGGTYAICQELFKWGT